MSLIPQNYKPYLSNCLVEFETMHRLQFILNNSRGAINIVRFATISYKFHIVNINKGTYQRVL